MTHTYEELKGKSVMELREIAREIEDERVRGYSQMNKEHLLPAICGSLGIDLREHYTVTGVDKPAIKSKLRELRKRRDAALEAHDQAQLKSMRRQMHRLNHQLRAHMS
jgi:hypothetical protein